jgi:hypothetical protein
MKHKKIKLGFIVVDIRTGEYMSALFKEYDQANATATALYGAGALGAVDVRPIEAHVPEGWKHGDSLEGCVDEKLLKRLEHAPK